MERRHPFDRLEVGEPPPAKALQSTTEFERGILIRVQRLLNVLSISMEQVIGRNDIVNAGGLKYFLPWDLIPVCLSMPDCHKLFNVSLRREEEQHPYVAEETIQSSSYNIPIRRNVDMDIDTHTVTLLYDSKGIGNIAEQGMCTTDYDCLSIRSTGASDSSMVTGWRDGLELSVSRLHAKWSYPIKDDEDARKEREEFLNTVTCQLNYKDTEWATFSISRMTRLPVEICDVSKKIACLDGYLFLIGCDSNKSRILEHDQKTGQQHIMSLSFKLCQLAAPRGRCFAITEDRHSEVISVREYKIESNTWHHISYLPKSAKYATIVANEEYLCIIGGMYVYKDQSGCSTPLDSIQCYNLLSHTWLEPLTMSTKRSNCLADISDSVLYIMDGDRSLEAIPLSVRCGAVVPPPVLVPFGSPHELFSIHGQLFAFGEGSNSIYILYKALNKELPSWMPLVNMPNELKGVEACRIDDSSVAIIGTEDHNGVETGAIYIMEWIHHE